jgi:isopenicillin-N epimerase
MKVHNWEDVSSRCRELVLRNAMRFCKLLDTEPLLPLDDFFVRQLFSIPIRTNEPEQLKARLFNEYKIEIPIMRHGDRVFMRYSVQAFNTQQDLDRLAEVVEELALR